MTDTGRKMPVDPEPASMVGVLLPEARDGNVVLWFEVDPNGNPTGRQSVSHATEEQRRNAAIPLWQSHFATCPKASVHRKAIK